MASPHAATAAREIASPATTPRQLQGDLPQGSTQHGVVPSSLDILFSFARSQLFFGDNLPSSPSFIRFQDPERNDYSDTSDENSDRDTDDEHDPDEDDEGWPDRERDESSSIADPMWDAQSRHGPQAASAAGAVGADDTSRSPSRSDAGHDEANDLLTPMPKHRKDSYGFSDYQAEGYSPSQTPRTPATRDLSPSSSPARGPISPAASASVSATVGSLPPSHSPSQPSSSLKPDIHFHLPAFSPRQSRETTERTPLLVSPSQPPRTMALSLGRRASAVSHRSHDSRRTVGQSALSHRRSSTATLKRKASRSGLQPGTSTYGQTLFNAIACLVGVGLLSEALAFAYAGWACGTALLIFFAFLTNHTAKLLAAVIRTDPTLHSYSDISRKAFGSRGLAVINFLFCMELFSVAVALMVLFGDTLSAALGHFSPNQWKLLGLVVILPTVFLPLRLLSFTSLLGVIGTFTLLLSVLIDALCKKEYPGSLWDPAPTSFGPVWSQLPLAFGLLLAGFSGHAVVPSLARDMAEPERFDSMIDLAYIVTFGIYLFAGAIGYLMFGNDVSDEITKDLAKTIGFPPLLNKIALWMIVLNPITKFALATRPVNLTIESLLSLDLHHKAGETRSRWREAGVWVERSLLTLSCVGVAIILPDFSRLMAFLGSFSAFLICSIIPLLAHSILIKKTPVAILRDRVLFIVSVCMMVVGTIWAFFGNNE